MKKIMAILCAVFLVASATMFTVSAAGTCEFIGIDKDTHGNWVGVYGADGYIIYAPDDNNDKLPAYAIIEHVTDEGDEPPFYTWSEAVFDDADLTDAERLVEGALYYDETKKERVLSCYYNNAGDRIHYLNIDIGNETKYITIYSCDYNDNEREANITVFDEAGKTLVNAIHLDNYQTGAYLRLKVSGKISIEYADDTPNINAIYQAIFFDNVEAEAPAVEDIPAVDETPAENIAEEAPVAAPEPVAPVAPSPTTGDNSMTFIFLIAAGIFISGAVVKIKSKAKNI